MRTMKVVAAVCLVTGLLTAGCADRQAPAAGTTPPAPASADVALTLAEVQEIVGAPGLENRMDLFAPREDHSLDDRVSKPCRGLINQDDEFGKNWVNYRYLRYSGASNLGVSQSIAVYPDHEASQQLFDQVKRNLKDCNANYPTEVFGSVYTLSALDENTSMAVYPDSVNGPGSVSFYHREGQFVVQVSAQHLSTSPRVAKAVLTKITDKIRSST